jgi:hypothetical protein
VQVRAWAAIGASSGPWGVVSLELPDRYTRVSAPRVMDVNVRIYQRTRWSRTDAVSCGLARDYRSSWGGRSESVVIVVVVMVVTIAVVVVIVVVVIAAAVVADMACVVLDYGTDPAIGAGSVWLRVGARHGGEERMRRHCEQSCNTACRTTNEHSHDARSRSQERIPYRRRRGRGLKRLVSRRPVCSAPTIKFQGPLFFFSGAGVARTWTEIWGRNVDGSWMSAEARRSQQAQQQQQQQQQRQEPIIPTSAATGLRGGETCREHVTYTRCGGSCRGRGLVAA